MFIFLQVIDYVENHPLHTYTQANFGNQPFDSILDTVGSQDLYVHCPAYLKPKGIYVNVGSLADNGISQTLWRWAKNSHLPSILGGTPRKYYMFGASISADGVKKIAEIAQDGHLKIFIDSIFKMEDTLSVCYDFRTSDESNLPRLHR